MKNLFTYAKCSKTIRRMLRAHDVFVHPLVVSVIVRLVYEQWASRPFVVYDRTIAKFNRQARKPIRWKAMAAIHPKGLLMGQRAEIALRWRKERRQNKEATKKLQDARTAWNTRGRQWFDDAELLEVIRLRDRTDNEALKSAMNKALFTCRR